MDGWSISLMNQRMMVQLIVYSVWMVRMCIYGDHVVNHIYRKVVTF